MEENTGLGPHQPEEVSEEQKVILDALNRVAKENTERRAEEEAKLQQMAEDDMEPPEDLDDPGEHSIQDMGVLARIGKGTRTFELQGNRITLRTLTQKEELEILSRINSYPPTAQNRAYAIFTTAVAIESVNGEPYFERLPLGPKDDMLQHKFKEFLNLYPVTINAILDEYSKLRLDMEEKARFAKKE